MLVAPRPGGRRARRLMPAGAGGTAQRARRTRSTPTSGISVERQSSESASSSTGSTLASASPARPPTSSASPTATSATVSRISTAGRKWSNLRALAHPRMPRHRPLPDHLGADLREQRARVPRRARVRAAARRGLARISSRRPRTVTSGSATSPSCRRPPLPRSTSSLDLGWHPTTRRRRGRRRAGPPASMEWLRHPHAPPQPRLPAARRAGGGRAAAAHAGRRGRRALGPRARRAGDRCSSTRERFRRGCDPLELTLHASVADLEPSEAQVLRVRQRIDGELVGGYSVVLIGDP